MSELSRKRPHADDGDITVAKKRVLTGTNGTPHVNGHSDQTEDEQIFQANLEKFRKEAIYRKMKQYYRENERSLEKIAELEKRKTTCEAGLAAMSACWQQLIEMIKLFVKTEDLTPSALQAKDVFDVAARVEVDSFPEFRAALGETANATEALVNRLMESKGTDVSKSDHFTQLQQSQTECAVLRSQLGLLKKKLGECILEKDRYHTDLVATENRIERSLSQTVQAVHPRKAAKSSPRDGETEDTERKPSSPSIPPPTVSNSPTPGPEAVHIPLLPESVRIWESKINELERENHNLKKTLMDRQSPPAETPVVHSYLNDLTTSKRINASILIQSEKAQHELDQVASCREEWQKSVLVTQEQVVESLKGMVTKRDAENTRLREQRDQANAELLERRQKDGFKWSAMQEQKQLSANLVDRLAIFQSELSRCKAWIAAEQRNEELLLFFLQGKTDEAEFIEQLRKAKHDAEVRAEAAQSSLSKVLKNQPDRVNILKAMSEAEERAVRLSMELDKFRTTFGDSCTVPPDVSKLNERIRAQAEELERLRLHRTRHEQAESLLFSEQEKLAAAWEGLEKQVSSKVFDLQHIEEKLSKCIVEKAKSENKYYAAMRDREAADVEKKVLSKKSEKQDRLLEIMEEKVKKNQSLQKSLEQELSLERRTKGQSLARIIDMEKEHSLLDERVHELKTNCQNHITSYDKYQESLYDREKELRTKEEEWVRQKRGFEEQIQQLRQEAATRAVHNHSSKDDSEYQHMRSLLLCSTCESNFRAVIITKCMHTFCKPCIDARISTRQRKCPACNVQFAQSDVSTLYMQ